MYGQDTYESMDEKYEVDGLESLYEQEKTCLICGEQTDKNGMCAMCDEEADCHLFLVEEQVHADLTGVYE